MTCLVDPTPFLEEFWQKKPRFLPGALSSGLPAMEPDELAWLATQPDVESRIVFMETGDDATSYRVEYGPFTTGTLGKLPTEDWTLLVHDVDKHLPDFRAWLELAAFIPDWRIDDLMISCAAPGGSVGPHVDNYDVFLCQESGRRCWTAGRPGEAEIDDRQEALSLLKPFPAASVFEAMAGDVLYLPPGIPHWGVAEDLCVTLSIGCRAPTRRELELGQERVLGRSAMERPDTEDPMFYADPDLAVTESGPGRIDPRTLERIRAQKLLDERLADGELARVFGSVVTDPKAWLEPESMTMREFDERLQHSGAVDVHGMARMAWIELPDDALIFVNGLCREVSVEILGIVRETCSRRQLFAADRDVLGSLARGEDALDWMVTKGLFDGGHSLE
jgi:50S ribosomal protein L16 3-hydroxylase